MFSRRDLLGAGAAGAAVAASGVAAASPVALGAGGSLGEFPLSTGLPSMAALRATDSVGASVSTVLGYSGPGTGGGGRFFADPTDSSSPDDGGMVVVDASGTRRKREADAEVTPLSFGARGDGVADDADAVEKGLAAQERLYIPRGVTLRIARPVQVPAGRQIVGPGRIVKDAASPFALHITGDDVLIDGVVFEPARTSGQPNWDIKLGSGIKRPTIRNCRFVSPRGQTTYAAIGSSSERPDRSDAGRLADFPYTQAITGLGVLNNTFYGYSRPLYLFFIENFRIIGNHFEMSEFDAIRIREGMGWGIISNNMFLDIGDRTAGGKPQTRDCVDTAWSGDKLVISGNVCRRVAFDAFDLKGSSRASAVNGHQTRQILVIGNVIEDVERCGVTFGSGGAYKDSDDTALWLLRVIGNDISRCNVNNAKGEGSVGDAAVIIKSGARHVDVSHNSITCNFGRGIEMQANTRDVKIIGNTVLNNTEAGIHTRCIDGITIAFNTAENVPYLPNADAQTHGIQFAGDIRDGAHKAILFGNTVRNNTKDQIGSTADGPAEPFLAFQYNLEDGVRAEGEGTDRATWRATRAVLHGNGEAPPASEGAFRRGDVILRTDPTPGSNLGLVAVGDGKAGGGNAGGGAQWMPWGIVGATQAEAQPDSAARELAELKADFNALLSRLRAAGLLET